MASNGSTSLREYCRHQPPGVVFLLCLFSFAVSTCSGHHVSIGRQPSGKPSYGGYTPNPYKHNAPNTKLLAYLSIRINFSFAASVVIYTTNTITPPKKISTSIYMIHEHEI